jgi:hypothetical protein
MSPPELASFVTFEVTEHQVISKTSVPGRRPR